MDRMLYLSFTRRQSWAHGMRDHASTLVSIAAMLCSCTLAIAQPVKVEITTRILPFDPLPGMKSKQTLLIDFAQKKITKSFTTGVTDVGFEIGSVRDKFEVENVAFENGRVGFTARGQTASGVMFMPNINYKFFFSVTPAGGGALSGCHDGYPAYEVVVAGKKVYDFSHKSMNLVSLMGTCDIDAGEKSF